MEESIQQPVNNNEGNYQRHSHSHRRHRRKRHREPQDLNKPRKKKIRENNQASLKVYNCVKSCCTHGVSLFFFVVLFDIFFKQSLLLLFPQ
jgi:hypothetical protein